MTRIPISDQDREIFSRDKSYAYYVSDSKPIPTQTMVWEAEEIGKQGILYGTIKYYVKKENK